MEQEAERKANFIDGGNKAVVYQNKDITSKVLAENLKGMTFQAYGLELPEIRDVRPTNIPAVRANELRLDNLFELADNTVALVDYESSYDKADKVKYLNYLAGVADRYQKEKKDCPRLRMVVIYTGDITRSRVSSIYDIGAVKIHTETAFLSELDGEGMLKSLEGKVRRDEELTDEELMKLIILPLSYRKKEEKEKRIQDAVDLAVKIQDRDQQVFALAGILAFTDKVIDRETADKIRRAIEMTQVAMIFEEEKQQAVERAVEQAVEAERKKAFDRINAEQKKASDRINAEQKKASDRISAEQKKASDRINAERKKASDRINAERKKASDRINAERQKSLDSERQIVKKMIEKGYPAEEIVFLVAGCSMSDVEALSRELQNKKDDSGH